MNIRQRHHPGLNTTARVPGRRPSVRGFTLVEVLLSMALTVFLMTGLMSVASSSMQDRQRLTQRQAEAEPAWLVTLARQVEADLLMGSGLSGAARVEPAGGARLFILTHNATPDATHGTVAYSGTPHVPVLVSYRLIPSARGGILVREERPMTRGEGAARAASAKPSAQVVATGIDTFRIHSATLRTGGDTPRHAPTDTRSHTAFTVLIDNRPVAMQPVPAQPGFAITVSGTTRTDNGAADGPTHTYERTLITQ